MHSRIFQIESAPVDVDDRICEDTIPEWFTASIADYVANINDKERESEIDWLMSGAIGKVCRRDGDRLTFKMDVTDYFESDFENFKKAVEELSKIDMNQFIHDRKPSSKSLSSIMFLLREAYDDRYGFYVWHDDELYTMQAWMRCVNPADVYYVGGIVDYHF